MRYNYLVLGFLALNITCDSYAKSNKLDLSSKVLHVYNDDKYTKPYVGIDYKRIFNIKPYSDWEKLLPTKFSGLNVFIGERFTKHFGMELGYSQFFSSTKTRFFQANETFFGTQFITSVLNNVKMNINSYQLDFHMYQPLIKHTNIGCSLGVAHTKAKVRILEQIGAVGMQLNSLASVFAQRKMVPRAGLFAEFTSGSAGIRIGLRWEDTKRLRLKPGNVYNSFPNISLKYVGSHVNLNIGTFIRFL